MDSQTIVLIAIAAVVLLAAAIAWFVLRDRPTDLLKRRFGPRYDHALDAFGGRATTAVAALLDRTKRVAMLEVNPLSPETRDRFANRWRRMQASFVDNPVAAVAEADALVEEVMQARGISVEHPRFVQNYREAHAVAVSARRGTLRSEDLRRATRYFRELFEDLLERATRRTAEFPR